MNRGFSISVSVASADELTLDNERVADEVKSNGLLTEHESLSLLPGAIAAAKVLIGAIGTGPFSVTFIGSDRLSETGELTSLAVSVTSNAVAAPAPSTDVAPTPPAVEAPVESEPVAEVAEPVAEAVA